MVFKNFFQLNHRKWCRGLALKLLLVLAFVVPGNATAADIEISFSEYLFNRMERISYHEKNREELFRKYRGEGPKSAVHLRGSVNRSRFSGTEWANERLIPNIEQFDVPSLLTAMLETGIRDAAPEFDGKIRVEIKTLKIEKFPLSGINSFNTRMAGKIKRFDAENNLVAEFSVSAFLVPQYTASRRYTGPNYAYRSAALSTRVGPIAAQFTEKALEKLFPEYDAPGLIVLLD